jgi:hypothetical protein
MPTDYGKRGFMRCCASIVCTLVAAAGALWCFAPVVANDDAEDANHLVGILRAIGSRFERARFVVDLTGWYQNSNQQRQHITSAQYRVSFDGKRRKCEFRRTPVLSPQSTHSWEYVYTDDGSVEVLRNASDRSFSQATARLSSPSDGELKSAFGFEFSIISAGTMPHDKLTLFEMLERSELRVEKRQPGGSSVRELKAHGKWGTFTVHYDSTKDLEPKEIVQIKNRDDLTLDDLPVRELRMKYTNAFYVQGPLKEILNRIQLSSFVRTAKGVVPTFVRIISQEVYDNGFWTVFTDELRFTEVEIDPVFAPNDFSVSTRIPNGSPIEVLDCPGIKFEWQDGKIVKSVNQPSVANLEGHWFQPGSWQKRALLLAGILTAAAAAYWFLRRARRLA